MGRSNFWTGISTRFLASILAVLALLLTACGSNPGVSVGSSVRATYTGPEIYQDHRDQQKLFAGDDGNIAYTDHGRGDVIVLLHGVPTSSWMYRKVIGSFQQSVRVISVDLMGFGSSDKPENDGQVYRPERQAERVLALLRSLDIKTYSVLMHDMGGLVAWEMMRQDRANISRLVVLNTIVNQQGFNHPTMNPGMMTRQLVNAYSSGLTSALVLKKTFDDLGLKGDFELNEKECAGYVKPMREGADPALYAFFTSLNDELFARLDENKTLLSDYQGDVLVLWGGQDETLTVDQIPVLQAMLNIPDENIRIYPERGHFLAEEMPEELVYRVLKFLKI